MICLPWWVGAGLVSKKPGVFRTAIFDCEKAMETLSKGAAERKKPVPEAAPDPATWAWNLMSQAVKPADEPNDAAPAPRRKSRASHRK